MNDDTVLQMVMGQMLSRIFTINAQAVPGTAWGFISLSPLSEQLSQRKIRTIQKRNIHKKAIDSALLAHDICIVICLIRLDIPTGICYNHGNEVHSNTDFLGNVFFDRYA